MSAKSNKERKETLRKALQNRNPEGVANCLNLPILTIQSFSSNKTNKSSFPSYNHHQAAASNETLIIEDTVNTIDWTPILPSLYEIHFHIQNKNIQSTFEAQVTLHSQLNHVFSVTAGNWLLPALHTVCVNTHRVAVLADVILGLGRKDHTRLENAVNLLQESFSKTLNDRKALEPNAPLSEEGSKKAGVLVIVNQLFSMFFRLNKLRLCKNLLRPVESYQLHTNATMGEMVTYRYYVGRLNTFKDQYETAEKNLDFALKHCHKDSYANKRRILNYLLPVKLLRGRLPTRLLLEKYALNEFLPIVEGIRKGDLRSFTNGLNEHQDLFIRRGTYLLFEKYKAVCYRNLFKRVYFIAKQSQLKLDLMLRSFKWLDTDMDLDEIECILANLIFRGYVKGYISHTNRVLVLSKRDPFPEDAVIKK